MKTIWGYVLVLLIGLSYSQWTRAQVQDDRKLNAFEYENCKKIPAFTAAGDCNDRDGSLLNSVRNYCRNATSLEDFNMEGKAGQFVYDFFGSNPSQLEIDNDESSGNCVHQAADKMRDLYGKAKQDLRDQTPSSGASAGGVSVSQ